MTTPIRVLIVEDSEDDAAVILLELKSGGYAPDYTRVDTAPAMRAALMEREWDLVLSDHSMPSFSGPDALRVLEERDLDVPFIVVSGSISESIAVALLKSGASDYVAKDTIHDLVPAVARALHEATIRRERRKAIEALRESEERFALAVRGSRDGLWDWSITAGRTYFSPRFAEMLGVEVGDLEGRLDRFLGFVHEEDRPLVEAALRDHLEHRGDYDVELRAWTKERELRWFSFRGQALWNDAGVATRMAGSLSDITARKQTEQALKEQIDLIRQQKEAIRTLSTPLIEVWEGVLTVPVLGVMDVDRATEMMEALLRAVSRTGCHAVILDLTGVQSIDGTTADHLIQIVRAVELLGARGIVVGIGPEVAQAMVSIGVDLSRIETLGSLRDALLRCMGSSRRSS